MSQDKIVKEGEVRLLMLILGAFLVGVGLFGFFSAADALKQFEIGSSSGLLGFFEDLLEWSVKAESQNRLEQLMMIKNASIGMIAFGAILTLAAFISLAKKG